MFMYQIRYMIYYESIITIRYMANYKVHVSKSDTWPTTRFTRRGKTMYTLTIKRSMSLRNLHHQPNCIHDTFIHRLLVCGINP